MAISEPHSMMDPDEIVSLYFDYGNAGGSPEAEAFQADRSAKMDRGEDPGPDRFFHWKTLPVGQLYALFEGADTVAGNDYLLRGLVERSVPEEGRSLLAATEGYYLTQRAEHPVETIDYAVAEGTRILPLDHCDPNNPLYEAVGRARIAARLLGDPTYGSTIFVIAADGRSVRVPYEANDLIGRPADTVERLLSMREIPVELADLLGADIVEKIAAEQDYRRSRGFGR